MAKVKRIMRQISNEAVQLLIESNLDRSEIAELTNNDLGTISRIFKGERYFSIEDLKKIEDIKKIKMSKIIFMNFFGKPLINSIENEFDEIVNRIHDNRETVD